MLDPGAMGTLVIGLESVRRDMESIAPVRVEHHPRGQRLAARARLARRFRVWADLLEPAHDPIGAG
jgi:hypothetical protein